MEKFSFIILIFVTTLVSSLQPLNECNQDLMRAQVLTDAYGIISYNDLLSDVFWWHSDLGRWNDILINNNSPFPRWQCVDKKNLNIKKNYWKDDYFVDEYRIVEKKCLFDFEVSVNQVSNIYTFRHAFEDDACRYLEQEVKRVLEGQNQVCFNGSFDGVIWLRPPFKSKERLWTIDKIQTKKGCVPLIEGACTPSNWNMAAAWTNARKEVLAKK